MASFTLVGTGTGTGQYIIPEAKKIIEEAEVLIGGERNLTPWLGQTSKKYFIIRSQLNEVVTWIKEHYEKQKVVVLVSGDPGFYSLLNYLNRHFSQDQIKVIPGISSLQVAFARLAISWHDAVLLNLHGRPLTTLDKYINFFKIALLTDPVNHPGIICDYLISKGRNQGVVHICTNLGYPDETIETVRLEDYFQKLNINSNPSVMVILNE